MELSPIPLPPIQALDALDQVEAKLIELLEGLSPADWDRPTMVRPWRVRHIAGHLLDTALRKLSMVRDGFFAEAPASSAPGDVRTFVDRLNAEGAAVYGRLSPAALLSQMRIASREFCTLHRSLDPAAPAIFPVSWAGEETSANWFDAARELTERWHHQEQIRLAIGRPTLLTPPLYYPVLDCFLRALPFTYRNVEAPTGTGVLIEVTGHAGGYWHLWRGADAWTLVRELPREPNATVTIPQALAWRLFTKALPPAEAEAAITLAGDRALAAHALRAIAIVG